MYTNATNVRTLVIAVAVAMLLLLGAGVAYATGGDSSAQPTGSKSIRRRASRSTKLTGAALRAPRSATKRASPL